MKLALFLALVAAVPAFAVRLTGGTKAEDKLRRFVEQDARLKARLEKIPTPVYGLPEVHHLR